MLLSQGVESVMGLKPQSNNTQLPIRVINSCSLPLFSCGSFNFLPAVCWKFPDEVDVVAQLASLGTGELLISVILSCRLTHKRTNL